MIRALVLSAAMTASGLGGAAAANMSKDTAITWYVTCGSNDRAHPVLGGTAMVNGSGHRVELVGPVAATWEGAVTFAREATMIMGDDCEPTRMDDIWRITSGRWLD